MKIDEQAAETIQHALEFGHLTVVTYVIPAFVLFLAFQSFLITVMLRNQVSKTYIVSHLVIALLIALLCMVVGMLLGYWQSLTRYREIMNKPRELADIYENVEITVPHPVFIFTIPYTYKLYRTNTIIVFFAVVLLLFAVFLTGVAQVLPLSGVRGLISVCVPLAGCAYAVIDIILWRWHFKLKVLNAPGVKTPIEID